MRPRKTILMYCANEVTRQVLEFQMDTWGFSVTATSELCLLPAALRSRPYDLVLLLPGFERREWREFRKIASALEVMQMESNGSIRIHDRLHVLPEQVTPGIHRIPSVAINSAEYLREQLKIIVSRKRGPKKRHALQDLAVCA